MAELLTKMVPPSGTPPLKTAAGFEGDPIEDLGERIMALSKTQKKNLTETVRHVLMEVDHSPNG